MQYLRLFRVSDLILLVLTQYFIRFFVIKPFYSTVGIPLQIQEPFFAFLVLASLCIMAGGYLMNDYYDLRITGFAGEKNYVSKIISAQSAYNASLAFSAIGCVLGLVVAWKIGFFNMGLLFIVFATILYFYALRYKRLLFWGDFCIALLASISVGIIWLFEFFALRKNPFQFGDILGIWKDINHWIFLISGFVFVLIFIRQMLKDILLSDFEQPNADNKMISVVLGMKNTVKIASVLTILLIILLAIVEYMFFSKNTRSFIFASSILIQLPLIVFCFKLFKAKTKEDFQFLSMLLKIILLIAILLTLYIQSTIS